MSTRRRLLLAPGPLAVWIVGFGQSLRESGYCKSSVDAHLAGARKLDRWLAERKLGLEDLGGVTAREFVRSVASMRLLGLLVEFLRGIGVEVSPEPPSALERFLGDYRSYLVVERGLGAFTVDDLVQTARWFMQHRCGGDPEWPT